MNLIVFLLQGMFILNLGVWLLFFIVMGFDTIKKMILNKEKRLIILLSILVGVYSISNLLYKINEVHVVQLLFYGGLLSLYGVCVLYLHIEWGK